MTPAPFAVYAITRDGTRYRRVVGWKTTGEAVVVDPETGRLVVPTDVELFVVPSERGER